MHGICVEKNYQLPEEDPARKFKGRGVLLGDQVKTQNYEAALFQDLGNSPATFEASRWADFYGCLEGHDVQMADAIRAYIQAKLTGTPCWVELPWEAWPPHLQEYITKMGFKRPMCRLNKALYGHPDSGTMWEKHCDESVKQLNFKPVGPEWPSMYFHDELKLLLVIYVDDLKLAGPKENLKKGWDMLRSKLKIEPETSVGLYLGCVLTKGESKLANGTKVTTMTYDMSDLLKMSVTKYLEIVGKDTVLKKVATPILPDATKDHPARAPCSSEKNGAVVCTWCGNSFLPCSSPSRGKPSGDDVKPDATDKPRGALAPHAASILMKLLYAARIARFDLLRAINTLARNVTKWTISDDAKLHHLMCYVHHSSHQQMIGWVGDKKDELSLAVFADADYAGCGQSLKSTSGAHMHIQGKHTRFPLAGGSKRQGCVSHSTPEAEIVAADYALRTLGIPSISAWETLMKCEPRIVFYDDNQAMINVMRSGRNPTMRHMERTHGISITWLHDMFKRSYVILVYEVTARMAADIHTKGFDDAIAWKHACMLINILTQIDVSSREVLELMKPTHDGITYTKQLQSDRSSKIPTYPYTKIPVVPPEVYLPGHSSKEGLQEIKGADPFVMCRTPKLYRLRPPGAPPGQQYLRSTWILQDSKWEQIEDRVTPALEPVRFDRWVERAFFQFHPIDSHISTPSKRVDPTYAQLFFSLRPIVQCQTLRQTLRDPTGYLPIHQCSPSAINVLNTLTRLVHGGSEGCRGSPVIYDNFATDPEEQEHAAHDVWELDAMDSTLTRKHWSPRRKAFCPSDAPNCPVDMSRIMDVRVTHRQCKLPDGKTLRDRIVDHWRHQGNGSHTKTDRKWTGCTTFRLRKKEKGDEEPSPFVYIDECKNAAVALCGDAKVLKTIPLNKIKVPDYVAVTRQVNESKAGDRIAIVNVNDAQGIVTATFRFRMCEEDQGIVAEDESLIIDLYDIGDKSALLLLCSEEVNLFTRIAPKFGMPVITVSLGDDLLCPYGLARAKAVIRTCKDVAMFAGPCTGGSAWSRFNSVLSEANATSTRLKQYLYWDLWERFEEVLVKVMSVGAGALLELPRHCMYWDDQRMIDLVEGTDCDSHQFDGCMYGLGLDMPDRQSVRRLIKKPWQIVSWNIDFGNQLCKKCDGSHVHRDCAGKLTKHTQLYTKTIVELILKTVSIRARSLDVDQDLNYALPCIFVRSKTAEPIEHEIKHTMPREITRSHDHKVESCHEVFYYEQDCHDAYVLDLFVTCSRIVSRLLRSLCLIVSGCCDMASSGGVLNYDQGTAGYPIFLINIVDSLVEMSQRRQIFLPPRMAKMETTLTQVGAWMRIGLPPLVALSLGYALSRSDSRNKGKLKGILRMVAAEMDDKEKGMKVNEFVKKCQRAMAAVKGRYGNDSEDKFGNLTRYVFEAADIGMVDDLWTDCMEVVAENKMDGNANAYSLWTGYDSSNIDKQESVAAEDEANDLVYGTRQRSYVDIFSRVYHFDASRTSFDRAHIVISDLLRLAESECERMALAIRWHNKMHQDDQINAINVLEDLSVRRRGLGKYRSAAQNHLEAVYAVMGVLSTFEDADSDYQAGIYYSCKSLLDTYKDVVLPRVTEWIPIDPTIYRMRYHAPRAEEGEPTAIYDRKQAKSTLIDYVEETKSKINMGQMPPSEFWSFEANTGPRNPSPENRPKWSPPLESDVKPKTKPMPKKPDGPTRWEKRHMDPDASSSAAGQPSSSSQGVPGAGASQAGTPAEGRMNAVPSEWFTLPIPIGTMRKPITGMDYFKEKNQRIQILVQRNDAAVGQTIEGPSSATLTHSWKQYVRRTVTYLSLWNGSMSENMVEAACARDDRYWFNRFTELYDQMSLNVIGGMISPTAAFDLCYPLQEKYESYQPEVLEMNRTTKGFKPGFMGELAVKNVQTGVLEVKGLGEMKTAPILLITDFAYYTRSNAGKRTDFDLGMMNHGWSSLTWKSSIPDLSDPNNPTDPMALPTNILRCASEAKDERPRTVHVWLSLAHLIVKDVDAKLGELQYKTGLVSNDFIELLAVTIVKVQKLLNAPVVVRICPDALFHDASGSFSKIAGELKDALTESGLLATVSDKFWRSMFLAAPGSPYAKKGGLSYIHSVAEKFLMRERLLITCFLNSGIVDKINKEHEMVYEKTLVDPQNYYEFLRDEKVQRRSSQEASQEDEASKRRRRQKTHESKMPWMGETFGVLEPEPNYEQGSMWIKIDDDIADDTVYRCDTCETANPTTFAEHTANKDTCFNCCANECRLISLAESRNDVFRTAARMLYHFGMSKCPGTPDSEVANMNPHHDLMSFIVEMARSFAKCPSFQKEVSCFGGVRVSASLTKTFFRSGRVKSIFVVKEREGNATYYRGSIDLGNVTYSRYMSTILSKEIFEELFGTEPKPTEERVADMVEAIMGAFEVATMLPHVFQSWGDVEALQHGFEESLKKVTASLHDYSNLENRKRVRVRTLDPLSEEAQVIPIILKKICKPCVIPKYTIPYHLKDDLKDNPMGDDDQAIPQDTQADIQDDVEMGQEEENKEEMEVDEEPTEDMTDAQKVLLEHLSRLEDAMATTPFCIQCSSSGHVTTECPQGTSSDQMKVTDVIVNWRKRIMQEDDPSQEPRAKRKKSSKPSSSRSKVNDEFLKEEMLKAKVMVWYVDDSQPMDVAADRVEGGARKYNARTLADTGPSNLRHLIDIVERAFRFTKTLEPKSSASFYPLPARPESKGYKPIDPKTKFGTVELVPINGVTFAHVEYDYGDLTYRTATDWVDDYSKEDKYLSKQLGNKLRHYIGRTVNYWGSRFDPIHCDEGGWVSWEDLVADDAVWQDEDSYRHRWQSQGNQISYKTRLAKFLEQNYRCYKKTKRVRFQMLAVKIPLDEIPL